MTDTSRSFWEYLQSESQVHVAALHVQVMVSLLYVFCIALLTFSFIVLYIYILCFLVWARSNHTLISLSYRYILFSL